MSCTFVPQFSCPFSPCLFSLLPLLYLPVPCTLPASPHSSPFPISDYLHYMHGNRRGVFTSSLYFVILSSSLLFLLFSPSQGTFISWFSGEMIAGPQNITRNFTLSEIPVYVRAGAIIPMKTDDFCESQQLYKIKFFVLQVTCFLLLQYHLVLLRRFQAN